MNTKWRLLCDYKKCAAVLSAIQPNKLRRPCQCAFPPAGLINTMRCLGMIRESQLGSTRAVLISQRLHVALTRYLNVCGVALMHGQVQGAQRTGGSSSIEDKIVQFCTPASARCDPVLCGYSVCISLATCWFVQT